MRAVSRAALGVSALWLLALPAGSARAQVQQYDPNAANQSLARQSDMRALQQQRTSDFNTLNLQAQRNVQYRPDASDLAVYGLRRGGGRHGAVRARGGFNTSKLCCCYSSDFNSRYKTCILSWSRFSR